MEIFDVFSMNGIENYPAAGEIFLENVILKVSQTHFPKDLYAKGGHKFFRGGGGGGGAVKYPGPLRYVLPPLTKNPGYVAGGHTFYCTV